MIELTFNIEFSLMVGGEEGETSRVGQDNQSVGWQNNADFKRCKRKLKKKRICRKERFNFFFCFFCFLFVFPIFLFLIAAQLNKKKYLKSKLEIEKSRANRQLLWWSWRCCRKKLNNKVIILYTVWQFVAGLCLINWHNVSLRARGVNKKLGQWIEL